ncbi:hypothetical protein MYK68_14175 [Gordonia sp. PP30]|uniref:ImmA/IrrE family metallo-endopeptidase n=1 Tax=Gordonia sp. PP30 TaxID=2935861 RepID=UPI0020001ADC|nr:hypothetical protein [Gordonia sp. PP30]UQE73878.1 hypothetical protein MYK68_14175 [Gordonia sp. PP30]
MILWHPWRWLRDRYPDVVVLHTPLPAGRMGRLSGMEILLDHRLTQAERRCTLTHELVHIERRGAEHPSPAVEESLVEQETARRLITLGQLVDAFRWLRHPDLPALAEHLWVDQQTALTRMQHLDPLEVAEIEHACDGDWSWIMPREESA